MLLVDLRDASCKRTCIHYEPHPLTRRFDGCIGHWFTQAEMVDDYMHVPTLSRIAHDCSASFLNAGAGEGTTGL